MITPYDPSKWPEQWNRIKRELDEEIKQKYGMKTQSKFQQRLEEAERSANEKRQHAEDGFFEPEELETVDNTIEKYIFSFYSGITSFKVYGSDLVHKLESNSVGIYDFNQQLVCMCNFDKYEHMTKQENTAYKPATREGGEG